MFFNALTFTVVAIFPKTQQNYLSTVKIEGFSLPHMKLFEKPECKSPIISAEIFKLSSYLA